MAGTGDSEDRPWYVQQDQEVPAPPVSVAPDFSRSADAQASSDYMSRLGDSSLVGALGGAAPAPAGGNGMGALMLPLLLSQMQQRQQVSPLGAFANAYSVAQGGKPVIQPPAPMSQYQQFEAIHAILKDQAVSKDRSDRFQLLQKEEDRRQAESDDRRNRAADEDARKKANFQLLEAKRLMGAEQGPLRQMAATNYLDAASKLGLVIGDNDAAIIKAIGDGALTHKHLNENLQDIVNGVPDNVILARPGMTPEILEGLKQPGGAVQILSDETNMARRKKKAETEEKEFAVIKNRIPELDGPFARFMIQQARNEGTDITKVDDATLARYQKAAVLAQNAEQINLEQQKSKIIQQREIAVNQASQGLHLANQKAFEEFKWNNTPAATTGHIYMRPDGQTATVKEMQQSERALADKGFFRATPVELKQVNLIQSLKVQMENVQNAVEKVNYLGGFASREGLYGKIPVVGPLAEDLTHSLGLARRTAQTPELLKALSVLEQKKADMVRFARENGDNLRALGAVAPDMNVVDTNRGYPAVKQVLSDMTAQMKAAVTKSRTPGAWDAEPTLLPKTQGQLNAQAKQMLDNAAARLKSMPGMTPEVMNQELENLKRQLLLRGGE